MLDTHLPPLKGVGLSSALICFGRRDVTQEFLFHSTAALHATAWALCGFGLVPPRANQRLLHAQEQEEHFIAEVRLASPYMPLKGLHMLPWRARCARLKFFGCDIVPFSIPGLLPTYIPRRLAGRVLWVPGQVWPQALGHRCLSGHKAQRLCCRKQCCKEKLLLFALR